MNSGRCLIFTALLLLACTSLALAQTDATSANFTLQVASFPDTELANKFVVQLVKAGEHPACATVELQGRGYWTRVFVGLFATTDAARRYGENLEARGIIDDYLVRRADQNHIIAGSVIGAVTRPRRVSPNIASAGESTNKADLASNSVLPSHTNPNNNHSTNQFAVNGRAAKPCDDCTTPAENPNSVLPFSRNTLVSLAPPIDTSKLPRPDPVLLAFKLIVGDTMPDTVRTQGRGGLWITGDIAEGLSRLQWIAGEENAALVKVHEGGRVELDKRLLARASDIGVSPRVDDPLRVAHYISSNEGLLLLVQMVEGQYRYLLHIGNQIPTLGKTIDVTGSINLDNNYDSRINRYRKGGQKLNEERPPDGFAAIIGLNPVAQWFNLSTHSWVPVGEITLHELAEAYAKVALGLDYLEQGSNPGAHAIAIDRERRMKAQRPGADIVLTVGSNRVLKSQQEIRLFYAEAGVDIGKQ